MAITNRSNITAPLILLSLLALLTAWISHVVQTPNLKLDGPHRHNADFIVSNFVTTQTDSEGRLRYKLASVEMKHFPDDDSTHLTRPRYTQFVANKFYTEVQAQRGLVSSDGDKVQLLDGVKITRRGDANKAELTITSQDLTILPKQDLVQTNSPVVIRQAPNNVIYATGMVFDKEKQTLTLLHKVRAHYEKTKPNSVPKPSKPFIPSASNAKQV
jgi:lipopolysaccharide export system protein LptC